MNWGRPTLTSETYTCPGMLEALLQKYPAYDKTNMYQLANRYLAEYTNTITPANTARLNYAYYGSGQFDKALRSYLFAGLMLTNGYTFTEEQAIIQLRKGNLIRADELFKQLYTATSNYRYLLFHNLIDFERHASRSPAHAAVQTFIKKGISVKMNNYFAVNPGTDYRETPYFSASYKSLENTIDNTAEIIDFITNVLYLQIGTRAAEPYRVLGDLLAARGCRQLAAFAYIEAIQHKHRAPKVIWSNILYCSRGLKSDHTILIKNYFILKGIEIQYRHKDTDEIYRIWNAAQEYPSLFFDRLLYNCDITSGKYSVSWLLQQMRHIKHADRIVIEHKAEKQTEQWIAALKEELDKNANTQ